MDMASQVGREYKGVHTGKQVCLEEQERLHSESLPQKVKKEARKKLYSVISSTFESDLSILSNIL